MKQTWVALRGLQQEMCSWISSKKFDRRRKDKQKCCQNCKALCEILGKEIDAVDLPSTSRTEWKGRINSKGHDSQRYQWHDHPDLCIVMQWCHFILLIVWFCMGCDRKIESQLTASQGWLVSEGFRGWSWCGHTAKDKVPPSRTWGDVVSSHLCVWHCIPATLGHPRKYSTQRALSRRCHPGRGTRETGSVRCT